MVLVFYGEHMFLNMCSTYVQHMLLFYLCILYLTHGETFIVASLHGIFSVCHELDPGTDVQVEGYC